MPYQNLTPKRRPSTSGQNHHDHDICPVDSSIPLNPKSSRNRSSPNFMLKYKSYFILIITFFLAAQILIFIRLQYFDSHHNQHSHNGNSAQSNGLPPSPKTTEPNKFNLRNYLSADITFPDCQIHDIDKDAISALQRAKTLSCRTKIANITCNPPYPKQLPRFCKTPDSTYMKYLGCFRDDKSNRLLNDHYSILKTSNSPTNCINICLQFGFPYAGLQYSTECFCGNSTPSIVSKIDSAECNMKCPEEGKSNCGGYFTMDVYETGVFREREGKIDSLIHIRHSNYLENAKNPVPDVRIVYFLTLNGRALRQVIRLIKILYNAKHYFYIHVDARQDYLFRQLLVLNSSLPSNIRFMKDRRATIWGGASLLQVLFYGMRDLISNSADWGWKWDYVINLSESDFPIKPIENLEHFLSLNIGKNYLKSHGRDVQKFIQKQGLDKTFVECEYRMWRTGNRTLPTGILIDGGSDWFGLYYDFVKYVVESEDELVQGLLKVFKHTLLPAESFFHTVLRNSELCHTFVDNNLHVTNWKRKFGCKCQYKSIVDWCGCSPNDFRLSDWSRIQLTKTRHLYFARKFESIINQGIINKLEADVNPNFNPLISSLDRYWESIYHKHDLSPTLVDDAILTLGHSLSRITSTNLMKEFTLVTSAIPTEILVHTHKDEIQGILVRSEIATSDPGVVIAESWFKFVNVVSYEPFSRGLLKYYNKIKKIQIGTNYEQKEQIFRNFCNAIGPLSEPILSYRVTSSDESLNITFVWTNPSNSVQAVQYFVSGTGDTVNFVKPSLKQPLLPGTWTVKILTDDGALIATTLFYVSLLEFYNGRPITPTADKQLNFHTRQNQSSETRSSEIQGLVDEFNSKFYKLEDICIEQTSKSTETLKYSKNCVEVEWSSSYPDPKGTIVGISLETGQLV